MFIRLMISFHSCPWSLLPACKNSTISYRTIGGFLCFCITIMDFNLASMLCKDASALYMDVESK